MRWNNAATDAVVRIALRSLPFIPAPEVYDLIRSVGRSEQDLDRQIKEAFDALSKSSSLVGNLEAMLKEREAKLTELQIEYERIAQLSSLTQEQASAVASSLELVLGRSAAKERFMSFIINIVAGLFIFILGIFASDWIKSLVVLMVPNLKH